MSMKNFTMTDLEHLMAIDGELCLSIYMSADPAGGATDEQRIRFKNLLRQAEKCARQRSPRNRALSASLADGPGGRRRTLFRGCRVARLFARFPSDGAIRKPGWVFG